MSDPLQWQYRSGMHAGRSAVRVFRSTCGRLGKVVRTRRARQGWEPGEVRYFVWDLQDSSPEWDNVDDALAAWQTTHPLPREAPDGG